MSLRTQAQTSAAVAIAVALLLAAFAYDAGRTVAIAEPVIVNSAAEARRWFDDNMGRAPRFRPSLIHR